MLTFSGVVPLGAADRFLANSGADSFSFPLGFYVPASHPITVRTISFTTFSGLSGPGQFVGVVLLRDLVVVALGVPIVGPAAAGTISTFDLPVPLTFSGETLYVAIDSGGPGTDNQVSVTLR